MSRQTVSSGSRNCLPALRLALAGTPQSPEFPQGGAGGVGRQAHVAEEAARGLWQPWRGFGQNRTIDWTAIGSLPHFFSFKIVGPTICFIKMQIKMPKKEGLVSFNVLAFSSAEISSSSWQPCPTWVFAVLRPGDDVVVVVLHQTGPDRLGVAAPVVTLMAVRVGTLST